MKKNLILLFLALSFILSAETILRDWKSYTNTTHISDVKAVGGELILATWGGLLYYNTSENSFRGPLLKSGGLVEDEVSSLAILADNTLLVGTKGGGISRLQQGEFIMPLNNSSGFDLDYVYQLEAFSNNFVAVTNYGISIFTQLPGWPLPATAHYHSNNGLSSNNITSVAIKNDSIIICGSEAGIDYAVLNDVNNLDWQHLNSSNSPLSDNNITDIFCRGNTTAISTHSGINVTGSLSDFGDWEIYSSGTSYYPVFISEDGSIWSSEGYWDESALTIQENSETCLIKITEGVAETWTNSELGLTKGMVTSITQINYEIVFSFWGEGIIIHDGSGWSEPITQNCLNGNSTDELFIDSNYQLWTVHGTKGQPEPRRGNRGVSCWDGENWSVYDSSCSGLYGDNVSNILEVENNVFWLTTYSNADSNKSGINIYDLSGNEPAWSFVHYGVITGLPSWQVTDIMKANDGNIWICGYNAAIFGGKPGIGAFNLELELQYGFYAPDLIYLNPDDIYKANSWMVYQGDNYAMVGGKLTGFQVWNSSEIPETEDSANWLRPENSDFENGYISDAVERHELFEDQLWIASSQALMMYDGDTWYRFGKESTKRQYLDFSFAHPEWEPKKLDIGENDSPDWWYFVGQEHLYGGVPTYPTALLLDPFNVLWIGTANNGICRYDIDNNIFMTWNTENSPLFSNRINDLAYDELTGIMYIATPKGMNSVKIGISEEKNQVRDFNQVVAFPNPFYPAKNDVVRIENINEETMPAGVSTCSIYDLEGLLVKELAVNNFQQFEWDGLNSSSKTCSSGIYFYLVTLENGKSATGKIILIR
ncbi:MAG: T9SS type A sorting domain-containing protein [Candidatus Cloacimonetes bacterium]|nr:T9SS type A sorting domain-containing protein [Candidatus Cloacimonadota bacterium]